MTEKQDDARSPPTRERAEALLSRYGGAHGPTGHAEAGKDGQPVSLASFIGGKAQAPRLGHLTGDGRTSLPEAALADEPEYRKLPGLAKPDGSMAKLMEQRHRELFPEEAEAKDAERANTGTQPSAGDEAHANDASAAGQEPSAAEAPAEAPKDDKPQPTPDAPSAHPTPQPPASAESAPEATDAPRAKRSTAGKRIVVLISGSGSNLQAIIDATCGATPTIPDAQIVRVISNRMKAYGLERAKNLDPPIPTKVHSLKTFQNRNPGKTREDYDLVLADYVLGDEPLPDLIVLAGFMHIVSETFLSALGHPTSLETPPQFAKRPKRGVPLINLHPALPGAFDGANAIERAYDAFQRGEIEHTGIMVHEVVAEVDRGAPILVENVPIYQGEPLDALETRMHQVEHRLIVQAVAKVLADEYGAAAPAPRLAKSSPSTKVDARPVECPHGHAVPSAKGDTVLAFVAPTGLLEPLNTFAPEVYESDLVVAKRGRDTFLWRGAFAAPEVPKAAQTLLGDAFEEVRQGAETPALTSLLQGPLVTLRGHRSGEPNTSQLFVFRSTDAGLFVDEVKMQASSLCSAYSAVACTPSRVYVWHGKGSDATQRLRAMQFAGLRSAEVVEMEEATASRDWHRLFPGPYASGWHWRHHAALPAAHRGARVYVSHDDGHAVPFMSCVLRADRVALVDAGLELYVLIGKDVRGDTVRIQAALQRAEHLAAQKQAVLGGRVCMRPVTHVLVFPTLLPADLLVQSRAPWRDAHLQVDSDATRDAPVLLNVHTMAQARQQLARPTDAVGDWTNRNYLPVGMAPPAGK
ncbi:phosphoribosylglycinamide formyltransferase 1 [Malassezia obtusa]|uniref:phosphoribosylglycinamide formyltransferase 1 n=1 Tax=Malassezia obtusa TaxID=76774 RepID=A0AAF0DZL6_9BASI|nr:phosphoribosylglycinamide formyltransferase 1 [Malassezia obtusa]